MKPRFSASPPRLQNSAVVPRGRRRPLISLTPLIDVVFILVVFFMLSSSFLDWRSIALNAPRKSAAGTSAEGAILVEIRGDGLRLSGEALPLGELARRVATRLEAKPDQRVLVKPSSGVSLQQAVQVLDRLASVGATNLSLIRGGGR